MLRDPIVILQKHIADLKEKLQSAMELSQKNLSAFHKFKYCSHTIQSLTSLDDLPGTLEEIRSRLRLQDLFVVLVEEDYAGLVPLAVQTMPLAEMQAVMDETGIQPSKIKPIMTSMTIARRAYPSLNCLFSKRWETDQHGSLGIFILTDKYHPQEIIGLLAMVDKNPMRFHADNATDFIEYFADSCAWTLVTLREHEKLMREMTTDHLTGCHNRNYLDKHAPRILDFAERKGFPVALLFIDLDKFKEINDTLGHACGDRVLVAIARSVGTIVREYDFFIRLGGDEFLVLLPDVDLSTAECLAKRIQKTVRSVAVAQSCGRETTLMVSASIGVAMYEQGESLEEFIDRADKIMYSVKIAGK